PGGTGLLPPQLRSPPSEREGPGPSGPIDSVSIEIVAALSATARSGAAVNLAAEGSAMNDDPITYRGTVYPWQCDHMGHMNGMWYVGKFDEAIWNMFARIGLTPSYLREARLGMAAVEQTIRYRRELVAGDVVEVRSFVTAVSEKSITFRQTLSHADDGE